MNVLPVKGAQKLTESISSHLNKDVLSIIHEYISFSFDLTFLTAATRFFACNERNLEEFERKGTISFGGQTVEGKNGLIYLLTNHPLNPEDIDVLVIKEKDGETRRDGKLIIESAQASVSMLNPTKLTMSDIFLMLDALLDELCGAPNRCPHNRHHDDTGICDQFYSVEKGQRILTLYAQYHYSNF